MKLTDEQIISMRKGVRHDMGNLACTLTFARAIEAEVLRLNGITGDGRGEAVVQTNELPQFRTTHMPETNVAAPLQQEQAAPGAVQDGIQAVIEAARQWWCERTPQNWDDAELAKAVIRLDGDWPGCPDCDHDCGEPCMPATMQEQLRAVDCHIAQLVHEGKLYPGDGYKPPEGWEPLLSRSKRAAPKAQEP